MSAKQAYYATNKATVFVIKMHPTGYHYGINDRRPKHHGFKNGESGCLMPTKDTWIQAFASSGVKRQPNGLYAALTYYHNKTYTVHSVVDITEFGDSGASQLSHHIHSAQDKRADKGLPAELDPEFYNLCYDLGLLARPEKLDPADLQAAIALLKAGKITQQELLDALDAVLA